LDKETMGEMGIQIPLLLGRLVAAAAAGSPSAVVAHLIKAAMEALVLRLRLRVHRKITLVEGAADRQLEERLLPVAALAAATARESLEHKRQVVVVVVGAAAMAATVVPASLLSVTRGPRDA
jgi:hypothetical protein